MDHSYISYIMHLKSFSIVLIVSPLWSLLLLFLSTVEPRVQELLAVVNLPRVNLHSHNHNQIHDRYGREAEDESVSFAVAVQLLGHREHFHAAIDQGGDGEEPGADHGDHQVTDVITREGEQSKERGDDAQKVWVLPLVRHGYQIMGYQFQVSHDHLSCQQDPNEYVGIDQFLDFIL